jgi:hypothetical protein
MGGPFVRLAPSQVVRCLRKVASLTHSTDACDKGVCVLRLVCCLSSSLRCLEEAVAVVDCSFTLSTNNVQHPADCFISRRAEKRVTDDGQSQICGRHSNSTCDIPDLCFILRSRVRTLPAGVTCFMYVCPIEWTVVLDEFVSVLYPSDHHPSRIAW